MAFQVSPGVLVTEKDLTNVIPASAVSIGAFVGAFNWGPASVISLVSTEGQLVSRFGKPNDDTATSFFTAANFLAYGIRLKLVRVVGSNARNASATGLAAASALVKNDDVYDSNLGTHSNLGAFFAKYPGELGNSLRVSICAGAEAFKKTFTSSDNVTFTGAKASTTLTADNDISLQVSEGSIIRHNDTNQTRSVVSVSVNAGGTTTTITLSRPLDKPISGKNLIVKWEFADFLGDTPSTSNSVAALGGSNDELHVVVVDQDGKFTGTPGTVLEKFAALSKASDAKTEDGSTNYYVSVINKKSSYIRWGSHLGSTWGNPAKNTDFSDVTEIQQSSLNSPVNLNLTGGVDDNVVEDSDREDGYDLLKDADSVDLSFVILGDASPTLANYVVSNICDVRKDCVAFISPQKDAVVDNKNKEVTSVIEYRDATQISSSYAVMDSAWKYQYDRYNDVFRWVPLSGDTAGLCARTDEIADPWFSPAGYNRGGIKNVVKLSWNPTKFERDELYTKGINPVITTPGQGTILFGDKTLLGKPSAFDRLNVRRLFIILEKSIANAARFTLFEFNDSFTRSQFKNLVEPYLRNVQARRGIYDFKVVCDSTNNTPEVIDTNNFVGDIYIKPARSINTIQLNFVAVRTGVQFDEIVGKA